MNSIDWWLRLDGLDRNVLPPTLEGRCTLQRWTRLIEDVERSAHEARYSVGCLMLACCAGIATQTYCLPVCMHCCAADMHWKSKLRSVVHSFNEDCPELEVR